MIDEELLAEMMTIPEMEQALELTKESSYTAAELEAYDRYWDAISVEKTFIADAEAKGEAKGKAEGKAEGEVKGMVKGELNKTIATVLKLDELGSDIPFIAQALSLTEAEVKKILQK